MGNKKTENCMICCEELAYLTSAIPVTCTYCGKADSANIHCPSGHYVCNKCHASDSIKVITQVCLSSSSKNPMEMVKTIMRHPTMPMHGPEHHAIQFQNSNASIVPEIRLAHGQIADFMPERRFNMKNQTVVHNE